MRKLLLILSTLVLMGCASVSISEKSSIEEKVGLSPNLNVESSVSVGSTIFTQYRYTSKVGYRLLDSVSVGLALGTVKAKVGDFLTPAVVDGTRAFCTEEKAYIDLLTGPFTIACFIDSNDTKTFTSVKAAPSVIWFESKLNPPIRYEKSELTVPSQSAVKYELIYQGYAAKTLRMTYREFINDMARPAFYQDVSYEVDAFPTEVSFKSVKLQILSAGNSALRFKVLSGFN